MSVISSSQRAAHLRSRVRDYVLYIAIAVAVGALAILIARTSITQDALTRWGGLAINTAVLYGYFISDSRRFFRKWQFWGLTALLLAVHLTAFAIVLTHVEEWKLMWFMVMILEYPLLVYARSHLPDPTQDREA